MPIQYVVRTVPERVGTFNYNVNPCRVIVDNSHSPIDSFISALENIDNCDTVLMEDDLILCDDFQEEIEKVIENNPNRIVNFFSYPLYYIKDKEVSDMVFNQCTFYPKGIANSIASLMKLEPRNRGVRKNMYSILEGNALKKLDIKVLHYRPCLVQHLDTSTTLFKNTSHLRRTPYFIDYLKELGISYDEANLHFKELMNIMDNHFKEYEKNHNNRLR